MRPRTKLLRILRAMSVSLAALSASSCGDSDGFVAVSTVGGGLRVVVVSDCPRCDASASDSSFGGFAFFSNVTRETVTDILAVCGFRVVRGSPGSPGDPLQIAGCGNDGVELGFASNTLSSFALRPGFVGQFGNGIRIGDSLQDVRARDPGLQQVDPFTFLRDDGTSRVEANFDASMRLRELIVGRGFVR